MAACCIIFILSFFISFLFEAAIGFTFLAFLFTLIDFVLLYFYHGSIHGERVAPQRFSLGDENKVTLNIVNDYPYRATIFVIESLPEQFQIRDFLRKVKVRSFGNTTIEYSLRPLQRGLYHFGATICYTQSPLSLLQRRFEICSDKDIKVYPSYQQLKKYQLLGSSENLFSGIKKIRRVGHSMEFEQIKTYVPGDDVRTVNWKATARTANLMVNTYTDAREQQVYVLIDKGRSMKMPFEGMTLLDYSINATLSLLNIVLLKHDKAGLVTFSNQIGEIIPADKRSSQLQHIKEALYMQQTDFKESDYELLFSTLYKKITQRSLLILFTNFETLSSLERQIPYLKKLASRHLVCTVFFYNTLLKEIHERNAETTEDIYIKTIAERFDFEKKQIVKELQQQGIIALLTTPQQLNIDIINKYLELKARQLV